MKRPTLRQVVYALGIFTAFACFGGSGTNCDEEDSGPLTNPTISEVLPCKAAPGEDIVILGKNFFSNQGSGYVRIGGIDCPIKSWADGRIVATVPAGVASGVVTVANDDRVSHVSPDTLEIGTRTAVPEVEPNNDINGADATPIGRNQAGTGDLTTLVDRDHFLFECVHRRGYKLKVSPAVVNVVYVNGNAVNLDANGEALLDGTTFFAERFVVGLTGGTGTYTVSIQPSPAP